MRQSVVETAPGPSPVRKERVFNRVNLSFLAMMTPFVVLPHPVTAVPAFLSLVYLASKRFYLEALCALAMIKGFGPWYLGPVNALMDGIKLPILVLIFYLWAVVLRFGLRQPLRHKQVTMLCFFGLTVLALFSNEPVTSFLKTLGFFAAMQLTLSLYIRQRAMLDGFIVSLVLPQLAANAARKFQLWMPHGILEGELTNLYSGVWNHSQGAGIICSALVLALLLRPKIDLWIKLLCLAFLAGVIYLSQCRTGMFALLLTVLFIVKNLKLKAAILAGGIIVLAFSPQVAHKFVDKRSSISENTEGSVFSRIYDTRIHLISNSLSALSFKNLTVGAGFGLDPNADPEKIQPRFVTLLGMKIKVSQPVEYGNLYTGALVSMGIVGFAILVVYFGSYYRILPGPSRPIFCFLLIANMGEAIMLSPSGNPIMLMSLCLMYLCAPKRPVHGPVSVAATMEPGENPSRHTLR